MVPWPYTPSRVPAGVAISRGTKIGMDCLLQLSGKTGNKGTSDTSIEIFLEQQANILRGKKYFIQNMF